MFAALVLKCSGVVMLPVGYLLFSNFIKSIKHETTEFTLLRKSADHT